MPRLLKHTDVAENRLPAKAPLFDREFAGTILAGLTILLIMQVSLFAAMVWLSGTTRLSDAYDQQLACNDRTAPPHQVFNPDTGRCELLPVNIQQKV